LSATCVVAASAPWSSEAASNQGII
jgi:hypothetical protein